MIYYNSPFSSYNSVAVILRCKLAVFYHTLNMFGKASRSVVQYPLCGSDGEVL